MVFVVAGFAVLFFAIVLAASGIVATANRAVKLSVDGVSAIFDKDLSEDDKELAVRRAALSLLAVAWGIAWRMVLTLGAAALPIALADWAGLVPAERVMGLMLRLDFIVIVTLVLIAVVWLWRRVRGGGAANASETGGEAAYSTGDRLVHVLAFSSPGLMRRLARFDQRRGGRQAEAFEHTPPIFVTSLARGGTTALLNALSGEPALCSYLYRDMPFPTAPLTWSRLSGSGRDVSTRKRAHGDGLEIGINSPEAFDEVLWMLGWQDKYRATSIDLWTAADHDPAARDLMQNTFHRVAALRAKERGLTPDTALTYLSKNNANIARLDLLGTAFPGAHVLVVLRHPGAHALSLWRQHQRFLKIHAEEEFTLRYMRDIGHFEFGALHRPLAFPGFDDAALDPAHPDYWLAYWMAAFSHVKMQAGTCRFVRQDQLRAAPDATMTEILTHCGLTPAQSDFSHYFHAHEDSFDRERFSSPLLAKAEDLFAELCAL